MERLYDRGSGAAEPSGAKAGAALDLSFIYQETRALYSKKGRPSIDPVVLVKYLLIGYLFGIPSERQIEWRIQTDNVPGLNLSDPVPDHGIILDVAVTSGDISNAAPYLGQVECVHREIVPIGCARADVIYAFSLAHQVLTEHGITFCVRPIKPHDQAEMEIKRDVFCYDEENDCYRCPNGKQLRLNALRRSAGVQRWIYSTDRQDCQACPMKENCLSECRKKGARKLERSYAVISNRRSGVI